jgi:hypothetical protein
MFCEMITTSSIFSCQEKNTPNPKKLKLKIKIKPMQDHAIVINSHR